MIEKMKKKTYSNSITDSKNKYSKKRINNISNRIKSLEKDINKIKNKESLKTFDNKKQIEKKRIISQIPVKRILLKICYFILIIID